MPLPALLHDSSVRDSIRARVERLTPAVTRKWGAMSADQMMWHVSEGLAAALGEVQWQPVPSPVPLPLPVIKFMVLNLPWPKGAPTLPGLVVRDHYSFESERDRC